jgi:hypothetical protein
VCLPDRSPACSITGYRKTKPAAAPTTAEYDLVFDV